MTDLSETVDPTQRKWFVRIEWKPQDLWIGAFWDSRYDHASLWPAGTPSSTTKDGKWGWVRTTFDLWVCLLPMVPIHVGWRLEHS